MSEAVAKITDIPDDDDVDLDLDADDQLLREAIGQPVRVRAGGKVIEVPHPSDWEATANAAVASGDFDTWAQTVLSEDDYKAWKAANLRNYQVNALFEKVNRLAGIGPGKSRPSPRSSQNRRRR